MPTPPKKNTSKEDFLFESLKLVVEGIAKTFGPRCEVVLHDFRNLDHSIIKIENGHITGRNVGGPITDFGMKILKSESDADLLVNYPSVGKDRRKLKSSTIILRDAKRRQIGALCINFDLSDILNFKIAIEDTFKINELDEEGQAVEIFEDEMTSMLNRTADNALRESGKAVPSMTKADRIDVVKRLNEQGFFQIRGAVKLLAEKLNLTKFSIYNYLEEVKAENVFSQNIHRKSNGVT